MQAALSAPLPRAAVGSEGPAYCGLSWRDVGSVAMADRSEAVTLDTDQLTALHRHGGARFDQPRAGLNGLVVPNDFAKLDTVGNTSQPFR